MSGTVGVERRGQVATATMDYPQSRNALSVELMEELGATLAALDSNPETRCIVLAGSADAFASGADVRALAEPGVGDALLEPARDFWRRLGALRTPIVAAVSGWALGGGCELALACDMVVAAERTQFGQPEVTLGIIPGGGGTQRLARVLGKQRAMELVLTGRRFSAEQAFGWGLVNKVSAGGRWLAEAADLAAEVAARAPLATQRGKQAVLEAERGPLEQALQTERELFERTLATEDRIEGVTAFLAGRAPRFEGR